jgi:hypothetical protein
VLIEGFCLKERCQLYRDDDPHDIDRCARRFWQHPFRNCRHHQSEINPAGATGSRARMYGPFVTILQKGEEPFAMFADLWITHREWVRRPIRYSSVDRLIEHLDADIVHPAEKIFAGLLKRKAKKLPIKDIYV